MAKWRFSVGASPTRRIRSRRKRRSPPFKRMRGGVSCPINRWTHVASWRSAKNRHPSMKEISHLVNLVAASAAVEFRSDDGDSGFVEVSLIQQEGGSSCPSKTPDGVAVAGLCTHALRGVHGGPCCAPPRYADSGGSFHPQQSRTAQCRRQVGRDDKYRESFSYTLSEATARRAISVPIRSIFTVIETGVLVVLNRWATPCPDF